MLDVEAGTLSAFETEKQQHLVEQLQLREIHRTYQPMDAESKSSNSFVVSSLFGPRQLGCVTASRDRSPVLAYPPSATLRPACPPKVVTSERTFYMHGPSEKAMFVWIRALLHAVTLVA